MSNRPADYTPVKSYTSNDGLTKGMIYARTKITSTGLYVLDTMPGWYDAAYFDVLESPDPERCNWLQIGRKVRFAGYVPNELWAETGLPPLIFQQEYTIASIIEHWAEPGWWGIAVEESEPETYMYAAAWFEPLEDE